MPNDEQTIKDIATMQQQIKNTDENVARPRDDVKDGFEKLHDKLDAFSKTHVTKEEYRADIGPLKIN